MAKQKGSGERVLAELSQDPVARTNKYKTLRSQYDALERRADYLATRLKSANNQAVQGALVKQLQDIESRIQSVATEMNSISDAQRYSVKPPVSTKPQGVMDKVRQSLPYQIGSGVRDMIVDTGKGIGQTALYAENQARTGKAGTQGVMNPEDFTMGDVADIYLKEGAKNAGTYLDALNSLAYWGATGRIGSKPDSQDERFRQMLGDKVPKVFGSRDIEDQTVAKGAEVVADPLALLPVAGRVKIGKKPFKPKVQK